MSSRLAMPRWLLLALATGLLALAAAGCGGGNESSSEATTAPPATETEAPAATDTGATPTTETAAPEQASLELALDWFPESRPRRSLRSAGPGVLDRSES